MTNRCFWQDILLARRRLDSMSFYLARSRLDTPSSWHDAVFTCRRLDMVSLWHDVVLRRLRVRTVLFMT